MRVTILGSGGSSGVPGIGFGWGRCDPNEQRNRRLRPSVFVQNGDTNVLVDTSPDLRYQLLSNNISILDAVLYTHYHADHLHGIDDLRPVNRAKDGPIDIFADAETLGVIRERFNYVLGDQNPNAATYYKPVLYPHEIGPGDAFTVGDIDIDVMAQDHGHCDTLGFRFGPIAYSTDVVNLDEDAFATLEGVDTWIIGTLVDKEHATHAHVGKALDWINRIKPRRAVLTHLGAGLDYQTLADRLPDRVEPAYDGMVLEAG